MNIITADFNWISFLIVIVATIIGMVRSNVRKVAPKPVFQDEPELEPEADMMVEVTNRFNKQEQETVQLADSSFSGKAYSVPGKDNQSKLENPVYSSDSEKEQENPLQFDIRQAVISSEILRRPEF